MRLLAHGFGGRSDLPIPFWLALYGAGIAVVISFAALGVLWPTPRLRGDEAGRPLPGPLQRLLDHPAPRLVARVVVFVLFVFVLRVAFAGPPDEGTNLAPFVVYINFWVGVLALSLLLGPVWRVVNPLRTLHRGLARLTRGDAERGIRDLPAGLGYWPAVAGLLCFTWLELVPEWRARPATIAVFLALYATAHVVAAQVYGERWFDRGDGFEVYFTLVGRLSPLGRRTDGQWVLRNPLNGLVGIPSAPGLVPLVAVLIGSTGFDGMTRTSWWQDNVDADSLAGGSAGLIVLVAFVAATITAATQLSARLGAGDVTGLPARFAHTLVPIAVGYAIAHYLSLLLFEGQQAFILAGDPFNTGRDFLGLASRNIDYTLVSPSTISVLQVLAIVVGHIVGVVAAHDLAVRLFPHKTATRSQYPLLALMVGYTVAGVALLLA